MSEQSKKWRNEYAYVAGTHLGPNRRKVMHVYPDYAPRHAGQSVCHGYLDPDTGCFQGGGERGEILSPHDPPMLSMFDDVWRQVKAPYNRVNRIEMIDHAANEVYIVPLETAEAVAVQYYTRDGIRWGIPERFLTVFDADGMVVRTGDEAPRQAVMALVDPGMIDHDEAPAERPGKLVFGEVDYDAYLKPGAKKGKGKR